MSELPPVTVKMICHAVAHAFSFPVHQIAHRRRAAENNDARMAVCWLAHDLTPLSYPEIGRRLGNRDHTTILHAVQRAKGRLVEDAEWAGRVATARSFVISMAASSDVRRLEDADPVAAAERVMTGDPPREAIRLSTDEIVALSARAVALEEVAATTYQLLAHLDEYDRLRPRLWDPAARARANDIARTSRALSDAIAEALQGLGYEYADPDQDGAHNGQASQDGSAETARAAE